MITKYDTDLTKQSFIIIIVRMKLLSDGKILDVISFSGGVLFVEMVTLESGEARLAYRCFDFSLGNFTPITMGVYLLNKFGPAYEPISDRLNNSVLCDATVLPDMRVIVLAPDGSCAIFSKDGDLSWSGQFSYHDNYVRSPFTNGEYFWCTVPDENSIVQYDATSLKTHIRIGNSDSSAFTSPVTLSIYDDVVYVCNSSIGKIKTVSLPSYAVGDYKSFEEPIYKYFQIAENEVVWLKSGLYIL